MSADNKAFGQTLELPAADINNRDYLSKVINEFVKDGDDGKAALRNTAASKHHFNRDDVVKALSKIQLTYKSQYVPGQQVNINTEGFKTALLNSMAKMSNVAIPKTINQIDGRTVDFVEMIFGAFLRDQNVSDVIKSLLLRLQIPVIKTSLLDNNFFYDNSHPARKLLDRVAHLGIGIENESNTVYQTINLIIDQLLRSYDRNAVSFSTALTGLQRLESIEQQKLKQNEDVTRKQIIQEHARQLILSELQYHTMNIRLPKPVQPLILQNWSTYMFNCYLKFGKSSYEWQESIDILKIVSKSLAPVKSEKQWNSLKNNYMEIVHTVEEKLATTKQNKEKTFMAIGNLKRHYERTIKESEFFEEVKSAPEKDASLEDSIFADKSQDKPSPVEKLEMSACDKIAQLPTYVKPGVWFKIYTDEAHPPRRLKLSLITMENAKLVFVDRKGEKIIEKDAQDFAEDLKNSRSQMLEDHSVFDNALSQVIAQIASSHK